MYLIRMLSGPPTMMRDGVGLKAPMREVTQDAPTIFEHLPAGLTEHGGPNVEVRVAKDKAEAQRMAKDAEAHTDAARKAREAYAAKVKAKIGGFKMAAAEAAKARAATPTKVPTGAPAKLAHNTVGSKPQAVESKG